MPSAPPKTCNIPGCPELVTGGSGAYCDKHKSEPDAARPNRHARGYDARWYKIARRYKARHPVCVDPYDRHPGETRAAAQVDHIIPRTQGGSDGDDNLQSLCKACHTYKTFHVER